MYSPRGFVAPIESHGTLETIAAFFGLFGVGWTASGFRGIGRTLMFLSVLWWGIAANVVLIFGSSGVVAAVLAHLMLVTLSMLILERREMGL